MYAWVYIYTFMDRPIHDIVHCSWFWFSTAHNALWAITVQWSRTFVAVYDIVICHGISQLCSGGAHDSHLQYLNINIYKLQTF